MDLQDSLITTFNWRKKLMLQAIAKNMMTRREPQNHTERWQISMHKAQQQEVLVILGNR